MPTVEEILGSDAAGLLEHQCKTIPKESLQLPGPDFVERIHLNSNRPVAVLGRLQSLFDHGRLGGSGYVSILPVDQGIEHSAGASFAPNPMYFDPENIVKLAVEGGCNAVASTLGVLGMCARKYAHKIPFILKFNHNEFISYPNSYDQIRFASVKQGFDMGAAGVGATIYFGSEESKRQIQEVAEMFQRAHELGMFTVLWCYLRNPAFKTKDVDYHLAADSDGAGEPSRRDDRGRHHQAEAAGNQRRLRRGQVRQDRQARLLDVDERAPDRPDALPAGELLHGTGRPDQLRRRIRPARAISRKR